MENKIVAVGPVEGTEKTQSTTDTILVIQTQTTEAQMSETRVCESSAHPPDQVETTTAGQHSGDPKESDNEASRSGSVNEAEAAQINVPSDVVRTQPVAAESLITETQCESWSSSDQAEAAPVKKSTDPGRPSKEAGQKAAQPFDLHVACREDCCCCLCCYEFMLCCHMCHCGGIFV